MAERHYDNLEIRDPAACEAAQFAALPAAIVRAVMAPGWARHLAGVDPAAIASRAALARLPLLRKSELPALQQADPPFGGFKSRRPAGRGA
jgi:phenylacetate-CoA ligase